MKKINAQRLVRHLIVYLRQIFKDRMTKEELLLELTQNTYVMLRPSAIAGIGVFAIQNIPKGCREMFSKLEKHDNWITVTRNEVETMPDHARHLVENYCLYDETNYFVPDHGLKRMDISLYLNHSDTANLMSINDGEYFEAVKDITAGEELTVDYGEIVAGE